LGQLTRAYEVNKQADTAEQKLFADAVMKCEATAAKDRLIGFDQR
jgi:hypothetical protein